MKKQEKIDFLRELNAEINETTKFNCTYPIYDEDIENYIWVGTKDERIGNSACHYEVIFYPKGWGVSTNVPFVEVHFESATFKNFHGIPLPEGLMYDDKGKDTKIVYTNNDGECSTEAVIKRLRKLERRIGQDLRAAFDSQIPKAGANTEEGYTAAPPQKKHKRLCKMARRLQMRDLRRARKLCY